MGFDVLYLPPIHPIGRTGRKGRDGATHAAAEDPGSPWAIGADEGGHRSIHPELGTMEEFRDLVTAAAARGIDVALDLAFQASPDHPWVSGASGLVPSSPRREHPLRREPSEALRGHLPPRFPDRRLAGTLGGAARRRALLGGPGGQGVPGRQPAHQALCLLGVDDPPREGRSSRTSSSSRRPSPARR